MSMVEEETNKLVSNKRIAMAVGRKKYVQNRLNPYRSTLQVLREMKQIADDFACTERFRGGIRVEDH